MSFIRIPLLLVFLYAGFVSSQTGTLKGKILDETGEPIFGATIMLTDSIEIGTYSDYDGNFSLDLPIGRHEIETKFLGFESVKEKVVIRPDENTWIDIAMDEESAELMEIVVSEVRTKTSRGRAADATESVESVSKMALGSSSYATYEESAGGYYDYDMEGLPAEPAAPDWADDDVIGPEGGKNTAGQMTAGEWSDIKNWDFFTSVIEKDDWNGLPDYWGFDITRPSFTSVTNKEGIPLNNATIELLDIEGNVLYTAKSNNEGKCVVFPEIFEQGSAYQIRASYGKSISSAPISSVEQLDEIEIILDADQEKKKVIDIAFTIDATGSMGDEMNYLKAELKDVVEQVKKDNPGYDVNIGLVFYRDQGDSYEVLKFPFTNSLGSALKNISDQHASGGGDYPEAVHTGLENSIDLLDWTDGAAAKLNFLILDAPPHHNNAVLTSLSNSVQSAAEKGIRIIPVTASGIEKDTEFLMRFMAIMTGGTYVFITDHSGIGNSHLEVESTIGDYEVEFLNELMIRLINQYSANIGSDGLVVK